MLNHHSKKIVAITQRIDHIADRSEFRDALDQRVAMWVWQAGFLPVAISNALLKENLASGDTLGEWLQTVQPKALLLSGGNDVGEHATRDATERYLLSWAEKNRLPVLGICRGLQMMGIWAGGSLKRSIGHAGARHMLQGEVVGEVNSYHDFSLCGCPPGFEVLARSEDGEIEAIRHTDLPWEGWMWHPEREASFQPCDISRLQRVFE